MTSGDRIYAWGCCGAGVVEGEPHSCDEVKRMLGDQGTVLPHGGVSAGFWGAQNPPPCVYEVTVPSDVHQTPTQPGVVFQPPTRRARNGTGRRRTIAIHFMVDPDERAVLDRLSEQLDLSMRDVVMRALREMEARQ